MDKAVQYMFTSSGSADTELFAENIGKQLRGGEVIELSGDVGAGKTTFVRGLAHGLGSKDRVSSPTFTVSNVYESDNLSLHHYDFYRIQDVAIMESELAEVLEDPSAAVVIEWAESISKVLPREHFVISITVSSETERQLTCLMPETYSYIEVNK